MEKRKAKNQRVVSELIEQLKGNLKSHINESRELLFRLLDHHKLFRLEQFNDIYQCLNFVCINDKKLKKLKNENLMNESLYDEKDLGQYSYFIIKRIEMNCDGFCFQIPICLVLDKKSYKFIKKYIVHKDITIYKEAKLFYFRLNEICLSYKKIIVLKKEEQNKLFMNYNEIKQKSKELVTDMRKKVK